MRAFTILPARKIRAVNLSKNALRRLEWIDWYYTHGKNAEATCRHFSLSKSVFYRWFNRFNKYNLRSLEFNTKTRCPHKLNKLREMTTDPKILQRIYDIRRSDKEKSKWEIHEELAREGSKVAHNVIQKVIDRHVELTNVNHKKNVKKHRNYKIARITAARDLREKHPGSLVQIDTKHLCVLGVRFYLFVAVDCKSRYGFCWAYKTASSLNAADFLLRVFRYFPFTIHAVNTDNDPEYLLNFHKLCKKLKIIHYFTYPHTPRTNGRVERLIQTVAYEFFNYQDDLLAELDTINQRCEVFNHKYNNKRFHQALHHKTPQEYVLNYQLEKGAKPFSM